MTVGTWQRVDEIVRAEHNLWTRGVITAREAVEVMIAQLTLLDAELRIAEREAEVERLLAGLDEAITQILKEAEQ